MSIQTALLAKGAYVSQQQVRDHTVPGGGNDNEILETNIDLAFANLKIMAEGFDYKHQPVPQLDAWLAVAVVPLYLAQLAHEAGVAHVDRLTALSRCPPSTETFAG